METTENDWNTSAKTYRAETDGIGFYRKTNRELIAAGDLEPGMHVVDLSCGSGSTSRRILASVKGQCSIYAVDVAEEMLQQAQASIESRSMSYIHASADDFSKHIPVEIDRVFCNAAFFHYQDPKAVLKEVAKVLKGDGSLLFNIPDQQFDFGDGIPSEMAQVVATCLHQRNASPPSDLPFSEVVVKELAQSTGFTVSDFKTISIRLYPEDLIRFYSIPHVGARHFPELPLGDRRKVFSDAFGSLQAHKYPIYRWAQFVLKPDRKESIYVA